MNKSQKIALITGSARRIGAEIAKQFHGAGYGVVVHYLNSEKAALKLVENLNAVREGSAWAMKANLQSNEDIRVLLRQLMANLGRLDVLVNNASTFYPTPLTSASEKQWDDLMGSNLKAPFFLSQQAAPALIKSGGCIVNIVDIYAKKPLKNYPIYSVAKGGLHQLTSALAKEFAPYVRVNGVSPGVILWPEKDHHSSHEDQIAQIPLQRQGTPLDIAKAVLFLAKDADYITGQVLAVDGGKSLV